MPSMTQEDSPPDTKSADTSILDFQPLDYET